jgi:hypothetical protein
VQVGLLYKYFLEQIPSAYMLFMSTSKGNEIIAQGFKKTFSREVPIEFVGAWYVGATRTSCADMWRLTRFTTGTRLRAWEL